MKTETGIGLALSFINIAWTTTYSSSASKLAAALSSGKEVVVFDFL
jgi:hypothetical protein